MQLWVNDPLANHGWMLSCDDHANNFTSLRFGSREDPVATPVLHIEFTVVPEPSAALLLAGGFLLAIRARRWRQPKLGLFLPTR